MKRNVFIVDVWYSSLAHVIRGIRILEHIKKITNGKARTVIFAYKKGLLSKTFEDLFIKVKKNKIVDEIVRLPGKNGDYFNILKGNDLVEYFRENKELYKDELRWKASYLNNRLSSYKIVYINSPGTFGQWMSPPLVSDQVKCISILDPFFHPKCKHQLGTAVLSSSTKGTLQKFIMRKVIFNPFVKMIDELRGEMGLVQVKKHKYFYDNNIILDPNIPLYTSLEKNIEHYYQIGPMLPVAPKDFEERIKSLKRFKNGEKFIHITLGGSVQENNFIKFIKKIVRNIKKEYPKSRFILTVGQNIDINRVKKSLVLEEKDCLIYDFYDNFDVITKVVDLSIGILGQGALMTALKNGCPVIMCPINVDQSTHANLAQRFNMGINFIPFNLWEASKTHKLIKRTLNNVDKLSNKAICILKGKNDYQNLSLQKELKIYDLKKQRDIIKEVLIKEAIL